MTELVPRHVKSPAVNLKKTVDLELGSYKARTQHCKKASSFSKRQRGAENCCDFTLAHHMRSAYLSRPFISGTHVTMPKTKPKKAAKNKPKAAPAKASKPAAKSKPKATVKPAKKSKPAKKAPAKAVKQKSKPVAKPAKKVVAKAGKPAAKSVTDTTGRRPVAGPKKPVKLTPFLQLQRERLHILRDSLLDAMAGVAKDTLRSRPEGSEASAFGQHQADAGSDAYDKDFALSLLSQEQDALYEIEEALKRIEAGTYGICEMSGKPILPARLEALPFARLTVQCQAEFERTKKFQRNRAPVTSLFGLTDSEGEEETEEAEEAPTKPQAED